MSCKDSAFSYGYKGSAKYQLKSLATLSSVAIQSIYYDCKGGSSAMKAIGWNGAEFSVTESVRTLMQNIKVKRTCEVGFNCERGKFVYRKSEEEKRSETGREEVRSKLLNVDSQIHVTFQSELPHMTPLLQAVPIVTVSFSATLTHYHWIIMIIIIIRIARN